jgi:hypothetical protein
MISSQSVADQPGLTLSLTSLFIAFFVGISVRALIAPEIVRDHLIRASNNIHKDFKFEFKDAHITLSRGIFPDLSVIIKDVTVQSEQACLLGPMAEINEIRLPLSWRELFNGNVTVEEILVDEVNLSLRSEYKGCEETKRVTASEANPTAAGGASLPSPPSSPQSIEPLPLKTLEIQSLKIHYLPVAFTSFEIQDFTIQLKSESPQIIEADGRLVLGGDTMVGDYSSHAQLFVQWQDGAQAMLLTTAKGIWREGHYDGKLEIFPNSKDFRLTTDIRHLPLSQVIPVLKKYRLMETEFNGKQAWFSGGLSMKGKTNELKQTPIEMRDVKLEGNLGEISSASIVIESLEPLKYPPVDFQIRGLNLQEFLIFLGKGHPSQALGKLGVFNGASKFSGANSVKLSGDFSGLEFIFANRGERQIQTISLLSGELEFKNNRWSVSIDRVKPHQGIFDGKIQIQADRDFKDMQLDLSLKELTLSPAVQALMTSGGSIGPLRGNFETKILAGEIVGMQGQIKFDQVLADGISFVSPRIALRTVKENIVAQVFAQTVDFSPTNPILLTTILPLLEGTKKADERFQLKNFSSEIKTLQLATFAWNNLSAQSNFGPIRASGAWDEKGVLTGQLNLASRQWELSGFRSAPVWTRREK